MILMKRLFAMASHQPRPQTARPQAGRPPSSNPQSRKAAAVEGTKDDFVELVSGLLCSKLKYDPDIR